MYDMINIFEVFLPQLLRYPNPTDPLNGEAAALLMREPKMYEAKVRGGFFLGLFFFPVRDVSAKGRRRGLITGWRYTEYVEKYATKDAIEDGDDDDDDEEEMSSVGSFDDDDDDDQPAGQMEV